MVWDSKPVTFIIIIQSCDKACAELGLAGWVLMGDGLQAGKVDGWTCRLTCIENN